VTIVILSKGSGKVISTPVTSTGSGSKTQIFPQCASILVDLHFWSGNCS
jgi:hypothetical protein